MNKPFAGSLLFICIAFIVCSPRAGAQSPVKDYAKEWKKVDDLAKKNLPKSALAEVKKIYILAKKEKQDAQVIKSLVYMTGLQAETREDNDIFSIKEIEKEISSGMEPAASILNSLLAGMYWNYYNNHRWQLYQRTQTTNFKKEDIATWGTEDFHKKISELYLRSIKEEKLLQQTKLEPYDAIILKGNVRHLRPTLFDLLAHRALDYFENDERDIKKPAYAFEIEQAAAFDPAADFVHRRFPTRDSLSLQHKALLIYQSLLAFHLDDAKSDALIDADIRRIQFVYGKSVHPDKEKLYYNAINHIARQYENLPAASQAWYLLAAWHEEKASAYVPYGDTTYRFDRIKAKEICEKVLAQKDSSEGKINCHNLLSQVNSRSLQFSIEKVNIPDQPFRALISYRNFSRLYLHIIRPDEKLKKELENPYDEKYWPAVLAAKPVRAWEQPLPVMTDLQMHNIEIKIDALPPGEYLLVASPDKDLSDKKAMIGARLFYVSSISYVNNNNDFFVLNRDNGQPLSGANVQVWFRKYDYATSKYTREKWKSYKTDTNGYFRIDKREDNVHYNNYYFDINYKSDHLYMDEENYYYYYEPEPGEREKDAEVNTFTYLFSDRSIYRPGQTVFFKGISVLSDEDNKRSVRTDYRTKVYLFDVNHQKMDSLNVETNEYGSFSGKFQLPQGVLNGQFTIQMQSVRGSITIRVEEYKRPKFYVEYEPVKGTYKVNDQIKVTGMAKAYAGNAIDGASVQYRVVRQPRFIYPWMFWKGWQPPTEAMEIAHGEATTGKDGKFMVEFTAIPDLKIDRKFEPVFDYVVYADATDINGETRSGEKTVSVSYKALMLKVALDEQLPVDSLKNIFIRTENMNGEFEPANVKVTITRLKEEKRLIRSRYWQRPDQFVMTKEEYIRHFPYDEYDNESDSKSWEKGEVALEKTDSAKENSKFEIRNPGFATGFYVIEISTTDKNGEEVKDVRYMELYDVKSNQLSHPQYLWTENAHPIEPGETTTVKLGTSADKLFVVQQIDKGTANRKPQPTNLSSAQAGFTFHEINNEKKSFEFTANEADRGGYGVAYLFVKHNRFYQFGQTISVPWTNKDLKIEYATFRDKTLPGSEEKWKVRLTGHKNEKVAAEMLASMYDASLDQFYYHQWSKPSLWPGYFKRISWIGHVSFSSVNAITRPIEFIEFRHLNKSYDALRDERAQEVDGMVRRSFAGIEGKRVVSREMQLAKPAAAAQGEDVMGDWSLTTRIRNDGYAQTSADKDGLIDQFDRETQGKQDHDIQIRKNFNETAFFLPDLKTDSSGAIEFSFTMPEALTKWKFQALAHTKELAFGYSSKEIITQKQLMVQPNAPRFLREGDRIEFSAKVVNLTEKELKGQAELQLMDATTNQVISASFKNINTIQSFTVPAGQSIAVKYPIEVPAQFNSALVWRVVAKAAEVSDGEENSLPVLTNRMLVTESMPIHLRGSGTKNFSFDKLKQSGSSTTLKHHSLTIEYTSNPVWYAVQALPYMMEYPYDCAEQVWNRYYANALASMIARSSPRIRQVFEQWKTKDTAALLSNLQKNQELKAVLLEETPWVLQAKSEADQKRNIALLFDMVQMSSQLTGSYEKLKQLQSSNGGFVWFKGGPDDRYMTQYIVTGIGHLQKLNAVPDGQDAKLKQILATAIPYLDKKMKEDYDNLVKSKTNLKKYVPGSTTIQYLYMRSFFPSYKISTASQTAYTYFRERARKTWTSQTKYMQGMIALALNRTGDAATPKAILRSLKETSILHEELGRYWKDARRGWFWHEAPIERQSLLIEAFREIDRDDQTVDDLRIWLLKNKQTNNWESTKATAEACYALLLKGTDWLGSAREVRIDLGPAFVHKTPESEAGTGYIKQTIEAGLIRPEMGNITVNVSSATAPDGKKDSSSSWGAVYWQYFENLDKITTASTPLKLEKKLFVETNTDRGPVLTPVNDGDVLKVGNKIKVRIELRVDRDMEYVHMKDMRASAMEPVNVLSSYKWQGGLGYYETTKDASTHFFFNHLRKGTYVFEYPLFITHNGNFSNGITTIQCMYAPEFSSHSEGIRIKVE